jgi:uncharacterized protein
MTDTTHERGFQFPTTIDISVMGAADAELDVLITKTLNALQVAVVAGSMRSRHSREGRFVSITVACFCKDRDTYDAIHTQLRAQPVVRWTM